MQVKFYIRNEELILHEKNINATLTLDVGLAEGFFVGSSEGDSDGEGVGSFLIWVGKDKYKCEK